MLRYFFRILLCLFVCLGISINGSFPEPSFAAEKKAAAPATKKKSPPAPEKKSAKQDIRGNSLHVKSAILMNFSKGVFLYEQNADARIAPASLTKVMTLYLAFEAIKSGKTSLKKKVKISKKASLAGGSRMGLSAGEVVTLDKLLSGVAIASGNDAAVAVAEHLAGSEAAFVKRMNAKAKALAMTNTVFKNCSGLPAAGQYTTARDLLTLSRSYLNRFPQSLNYHKQRTTKYKTWTLTNKNRLLGKHEGTDGLKTGWIEASGYNVIVTAKRGNTRMLAVVLGAPTPQLRESESRRILDAGFAYQNKKTKSVRSYLEKAK